MRLENKVAIITGGGSGIGESISIRFAKEGAKIVVADINPETAAKTVDEIVNVGGEAISYTVDVVDYENVQRMVNKTVSNYGSVDILVTSHGISEHISTPELSPDGWKRMIDINLNGVFYCCQLAANEMVKNRKGKIVTVASTSGIAAEKGNPHYVASKHGVVGLTMALALDYGPYGINVNSISPCITLTPLIKSIMTKEELAKREKYIALGRMGQPEDQANAALFLASSESDYVSGQVLRVDGGLLSSTPAPVEKINQ